MSESDVRDALRKARGVTITTGAGVSAESGIATFRTSGDQPALWETFDPAELATPEAFERDPVRVWHWYGLRRRQVRAARWNSGHLAIARFLLARDDALLVTQNVDGLHRDALSSLREGPSAAIEAAMDRILEIHGSIRHLRCSRCARQSFDDGDYLPSSSKELPSCGACAGILRPAVVWFGETLDPALLDRAFDHARCSEAAIAAGTSAIVHPAAGVPALTVHSGGWLVEVNPERTPLSSLARWRFAGPGSRSLPALLDPSDGGM